MHIDNANPQVLEMIINDTNSLNAGQSKNSIKKKTSKVVSRQYHEIQ